MTLRMLLVESDAEEMLSLREVLEEAGEAEYWSSWVHLELVLAETWASAEARLTAEPVDLILLNPNLADIQGEAAFRKCNDLAPHVPVVLLVDHKDRASAERMVRQGAQDFLVKERLDCGSVAHAVRGAIDRHRLLAAARASAMIDPLTGLLNRAAFQVLAQRDRRLARAFGRDLFLLVVVADGLAGDGFAAEQRRDLAVVEIAEILRGVAGPASLIARIGSEQFGILGMEEAVGSVEGLIDGIRSATPRVRLSAGFVVFPPSDDATLDELIFEVVSGLAGRTDALSLEARA